jgi:hypothetical protein
MQNANWMKDISPYDERLEEEACLEFTTPDLSKKWHEDCNKYSFNYLRLDSRLTNKSSRARKVRDLSLSDVLRVQWQAF